MRELRAKATVSENGVLTLHTPVDLDRSFRLVAENAAVVANLTASLRHVAVAGKQIHDANIVATMQTHAISRLITHNDTDFARFSHLITVVPLRSFV